MARFEKYVFSVIFFKNTSETPAHLTLFKERVKKAGLQPRFQIGVSRVGQGQFVLTCPVLSLPQALPLFLKVQLFSSDLDAKERPHPLVKGTCSARTTPGDTKFCLSPDPHRRQTGRHLYSVLLQTEPPNTVPNLNSQFDFFRHFLDTLLPSLKRFCDLGCTPDLEIC